MPRSWHTLGDVKGSVVNIGAGAGSYEQRDRTVIAIEPSRTMIGQHPADAARVLQATVDQLPLADGSFDAALAVLTVHHWTNLRRSFQEIRRVACRRAVFFTCDPSFEGVG